MGSGLCIHRYSRCLLSHLCVHYSICAYPLYIIHQHCMQHKQWQSTTHSLYHFLCSLSSIPSSSIPHPLHSLHYHCFITTLHQFHHLPYPPFPCRKKGKFIELVQQHSFDWDSKAHRELLKSMLMTACDVAAITKPWDIQKEVCVCVVL